MQLQDSSYIWSILHGVLQLLYGQHLKFQQLLNLVMQKHSRQIVQRLDDERKHRMHVNTDWNGSVRFLRLDLSDTRYAAEFRIALQAK